MFRSLSSGAIGANVENLADGLDLAARHGFAGYHFNIGEVVAMGAEEALALAECKEDSPYLRRPLSLKEVRP